MLLCCLFLGVLFAYFLGIGINLASYKHNKAIHGGPNNQLRWYYRFRYYEIDIPPMHLSPYHLQVHKCDKEHLQYFATLDDPVVKQIAEDFNDLFPNKPVEFKAHCLQAMIQQNVRYVSDITRFGVDNCWCFPIRTLSTKIGDCEDSAILYAAIGNAIGLDVVLVYFPTHMYSCVKLYPGAPYQPLELTKYTPTTSPTKLCNGGLIIVPIFPSEEFIKTIDRY